MSECIFCKIVQKDVPASIVYEDEQLVAFKDLFPQAPVHLLIVPKAHCESLSRMTTEAEMATSRVPFLAAKLAEDHGLVGGGWRLIANSGADAGQTVFHLHFHLLGGKPLGGKLCQ